MMDMTQPNQEVVQYALIVVLVVIAIVVDVRRRRIPNIVTFPFMLAGLVANVAFAGLDGLLSSLTGFTLGAAVLLVPVALRWWGAGDLKLLAAVGAIGGPVFVLWCALFAMIAGGAFALITAYRHGKLAPILASVAVDAWTKQPVRATSGLRNPYSLAIVVGAAAAMVIT